MSVDICMTVLLLALMAYHITGALAHEVIGVGMLILMISHIILNWSWMRSLHKGKYNVFRVFQITTNTLLLVSMLVQMISGIVLSRYVFTFLPISGGFSYARTMHHLCAYWGFVLMSIHIGLHWGMIIAMTRKAAKQAPLVANRAIPLRVIAILIAVYGVYAFISRQVPEYMFHQIQFSFFDYEQPAILFFLDYFAIMGLFVCIGHYCTRLIQGNMAKKRSRPGEAETNPSGL